METTPAPLFTLDEAAEMAEVTPQRLRDLVRFGHIVPAEPSKGTGRGHTHRFTFSQVVGLRALRMTDHFAAVALRELKNIK